MPDTREKLSTVSVALHWVIAIAMIAMVAFGLILEDMPKSDSKSALVQIHKSIGVLVLLLAVVRLTWRVRKGMPEDVGLTTAAQRMMSKAIHGLLLLATLLLPISGIMMSIANAKAISIFGIPFLPQLLAQKNEVMAKAAGLMHGLGGKLVIALVLLHVAGALKHHIVDKDGTLKRMLGQRVTPVKAA